MVGEAERDGATDGATFEEKVQLRRIADAFLAFRQEKALPRRAQGPAANVAAATAAVAPIARTTPMFMSPLLWLVVGIVAVAGLAMLVVRIRSSDRTTRDDAARTASGTSNPLPPTAAHPSKATSPSRDTAWLSGVVYVPLDPMTFVALQQQVAKKRYGNVVADDLEPRLRGQTWNAKEGPLKAAVVHRDESAVPSATTYMTMTAARLLALASEAPDIEAIVVDSGRGSLLVRRDDFGRLAALAPVVAEPPMTIMRRPGPAQR